MIQIGNHLDEDEQKKHTILLHDFPKLFSWTYLDMLGMTLR